MNKEPVLMFDCLMHTNTNEHVYLQTEGQRRFIAKTCEIHTSHFYYKIHIP